MSTVIDSSVWIDYLTGRSTAQTVWLENEMLKQRLAYEEQRIIERVLPHRFALDDEGVEVLPIAVQVLVNTVGDQS